MKQLWVLVCMAMCSMESAQRPTDTIRMQTTLILVPALVTVWRPRSPRPKKMCRRR